MTKEASFSPADWSVLCPPHPELNSKGLIRGVWYSRLLSGSQEAQRSQSLSLDEVSAPVGSAAARTQQNKWTAGQNQLAGWTSPWPSQILHNRI